MAVQSIGIAGAGIIGRLVALALRQQGHQVTILDQDPPVPDSLCNFAVNNRTVPDLATSACSYTAAGMLTPFSEAETAEPLVFDLGLASLGLWPKIAKQLNAEVFYRTGGTLVLAHPQDRADFSRFHASVHANIPAGKEFISSVGQSELASLEPELGDRFQRGLYLPDEAWLCSCCVMPALFNYLMEQGVAWHSRTRVLEVKPREIVVESASGPRRHAFDWVIDARGLGARKQQPALRGVRGEILWVRAPEVKINRLIRLMHPRYRLYIVPRRGDLYLIGATQIESEDRGPISVRSSLELLSAAYSVHPGFGEAQIVHSDTNLRPAFPNNQPQVLSELGLTRVNGLFRHGYLMGPAIAQEVSALINAQGNYQSPYKNLFRHQDMSEALVS